MPIWLDLVPSSSSSSPEKKEKEEEEEEGQGAAAEWASSFLSAEAREVLDVLGGVVVVFALPQSLARSSSSSSSYSGVGAAAAGVEREREKQRERARELVRNVGRVVRDGLGGWEWEGVGLAVGVSGSAGASGAGAGAGAGGRGQDGEEDEDEEGLDEWEDLCAEWGLEFVHVCRPGSGRVTGHGKRNEFGERMGMARVLEALQANDWSGSGTGGGDAGGEGGDEGNGSKGKGQTDDGEDEFDLDSLDFGIDRGEMEALSKAILGEEGSKGQREDEDEALGEEDVQKLERMMRKLQAVRDASAGLPEEQRKRMAKQAVGEVMKEL